MARVSDESKYGYEGLLLHVFKNDEFDEDYEVWWNMSSDFDGRCIGSGGTRKEAIDDAYRTLSQMSIVLDDAATPATQAAGGREGGCDGPYDCTGEGAS